jgi:hypothetical protein
MLSMRRNPEERRGERRAEEGKKGSGGKVEEEVR